MAEIDANQLLRKVHAQAGRIADLELSNEAYALENAKLQTELATLRSDAEAKVVARDIQEAGAKGRTARRDVGDAPTAN